MQKLTQDNLFYDIKMIEFKEQNHFDRIMTFFNQSRKNEMENSEYADNIYEVLGFKNYNDFDVINSFWTVFTCGLVITNDILVKEKKLGKVYYEFSGDKKNVLLNKKYIVKKIFAKNYFERKEDSHLKKIVRRFQNDFPQINELAKLCHAVVNFTPCPEKLSNKSFNEAKGLCGDVKDFLPLMVNKIEQCIDCSENLIYDCKSIDIATLKKYKIWLVENRDKCYLQNYFNIDDTGKLIGLPFFEKQSLDNPLPTNEHELCSCLDNIINTLNNRSQLILNSFD